MRRLIFVDMKMKFVHPSLYEDERKTNDRVQPQDITVGSWKHNQDVLDALLSLLVLYHRRLMILYNGKMDNVPRTNLLKDTTEYFNKCDHYSKFISDMMIQTDDKKDVHTLSDISDACLRWFRVVKFIDSSHKLSKTDVSDNLRDHTKFRNKWTNRKSPTGNTIVVLQGYRLKSNLDEPVVNENIQEYGADEISTDNQFYETPEECVERLGRWNDELN
jgi:hypothetical protein